MPRVDLTARFVKQLPVLPEGKRRIDYFDMKLPGFCLEQRASGGATFYVRYYNLEQKLCQYKIGRLGIVSVAQARTKAKQILAQVALGVPPSLFKRPPEIPTLADFVSQHYLPYAKLHKRSWKTDEVLLRLRLLPRFGQIPLDQIQKMDLLSFHQALRAQGLKPATANRHLILLRFIFNCAIRWEVWPNGKNPIQGQMLFAENNARNRYLSVTEMQQLNQVLLESENTALREIVLMLLLTGARKREVLDARWEQLDFEKKIWVIPITKAGRPRTVPLSEALLTTLERIKTTSTSPWLFPSPRTGLPFRNIFHSWNVARKKAGLAEVRIHDLRHSFASFLVNAGRSLYEVQQLLGHADLKTTQRYAHLNQDTLREATETAVAAIRTVIF